MGQWVKGKHLSPDMYRRYVALAAIDDKKRQDCMCVYGKGSTIVLDKDKAQGIIVLRHIKYICIKGIKNNEQDFFHHDDIK